MFMSAHIMIRVGFLFAPTMLRDTLDRGRLPLKLIFKSLCFSMPIASYRLLKQFKTCNGKCKRRAIRLSRLLKQPVVLLLVKFPEIALLADCAVGHFKQAMVRFPELALLYRLRDWKHLNFIFVPDGGAPCKRDNILLFTRSNVLGSRDSRVCRHREK